MSSNGYRLFFGFEYRHGFLYALAVDASGEVIFRARFPLSIKDDIDLDFGPASCIAATLRAFVSACDAEPVCGTNHVPAVLDALAKHLGGPIHYISDGLLEKTSPPGCRLLGCGDPAIDALQRAMLAGLAVAGSKENR